MKTRGSIDAFVLALALALAAVTSAPAATPSKMLEACKPVKKLAVPEDQMPSMKERDKLNNCSSEALYYGIGQPADPLMARHCAVLEDEIRVPALLSGPTTLMMVYANGNGAAQDYELALHFACEIQGPPAEVEARVARLVKLKIDAVSKPNFDFCDDATTDQTKRECAAHLARLKPATPAKK